MGGRGGGAPGNANRGEQNVPAPAADVPAVTQRNSSTPTEQDILNRYYELVKRRGDLLSLQRLRDSMPSVDKATLDRILLRMDRSRVISLEPDPNQKAIPQRARDNAIRLGGEDMHLITIGRR